ncbi:glycosyltransferase [Gluconobacter japonicus]
MNKFQSFVSYPLCAILSESLKLHSVIDHSSCTLPAHQDQALAELAFFLAEKSQGADNSASPSAYDEQAIRFLCWLTLFLEKNTPSNQPFVRLSTDLNRKISPTLQKFQKDFIPDLRNIFSTTQENGFSLSCHCAHEDIPDQTSANTLVIGPEFNPKKGFIFLSDCLNIRISSRDSALSFLSEISEPAHRFRQKIRQILAHDLKGRQARNALITTTHTLQRAEETTRALRINTRTSSQSISTQESIIQSLSEKYHHLQSENITLHEKINDLQKQLNATKHQLEISFFRQETIEKYYTDIQQSYASFNTKLALSHQALEALRGLIQRPAPVWRRLVRALRTPFIPHIPTLPEPPVLQDLPAPSARFLPDPTLSIAETDSIETLLPSEEELSSCAATPRILFVAGEANTPGMTYRCYRNAEAARCAGFEARVQDCANVSYDDICWADVMILWRVEYSGHVSTMLDLAQQQNVKTIFDADDIVFVPHYARIDLIDGIRSIGTTEERIEHFFTDVRRTLMRCDQGSATTRELAHAMHKLRPVVHILPNTYDNNTLRRSRLNRRLREGLHLSAAGDTLIRIGYATGTRTHQRDFAIAAPSIAYVLSQRPNVRLVLFREKASQSSMLLLEEFPEFQNLSSQIEWRETVPLPDLPDEFGRFDISIAPLEVGNVFCEAKSEIKFLEASLAGSASIVSPTGPFKRLVRHGETGLLAATPEEWTAALFSLVDDPERRQRMARDAYHDVLWPFSPEAQTRRMKLAVSSLQGDEEAAEAGELLLARKHLEHRPLPVIPENETLFHHDVFGEADVTVVITSYNYDNYILDALDSVSAQTLSQLDLIVVDDGSTDGSVDLIRLWMERNVTRFNRLILKRSLRNAGLGGARNIGMDTAETDCVMQLDADNLLRPDACETLHAAMTFGIAYAYPLIQCFNESGPLPLSPQEVSSGRGPFAVLGDLPFNPLSLVSGNRVDAMAMIAKWAWAAAGGYYVSREAMGWEDFDLWCTLAELGLPGRQVPAILADYRQHTHSMTNLSTEQAAHKARVVSYVKSRHPWINLTAEAPEQRL